MEPPWGRGTPPHAFRPLSSLTLCTRFFPSPFPAVCRPMHAHTLPVSSPTPPCCLLPPNTLAPSVRLLHTHNSPCAVAPIAEILPVSVSQPRSLSVPQLTLAPSDRLPFPPFPCAVAPIAEILKRVPPKSLITHYKIGAFDSADTFLQQVSGGRGMAGGQAQGQGQGRARAGDVFKSDWGVQQCRRLPATCKGGLGRGNAREWGGRGRGWGCAGNGIRGV